MKRTCGWVVTHSLIHLNNQIRCSFGPINSSGESIYNSLKLIHARDESTRLLLAWCMDWLVCQMLAGPSLSRSVRHVRVSPGTWGEVWWPECWWDLVWWVRSQREAKAEGWSSSVNLAHSKVAISQDWLAKSPLARWLFPLFLLFFLFIWALFPPNHLSFSFSLRCMLLF